jgi:hypothetical protein
VSEPRNADTFPDVKAFDRSPHGINSPDDFVTWNDWYVWLREFAVDYMQIGSTHAARGDLHPHLAWPR